MQRPDERGWPRWILAGLASAILILSFTIPLGRAYLSKRATATAEGSLGFEIERRDETTPRASDTVLLPGDRVRFTYSTDRETQFAVLHLIHERAEVSVSNGPTTKLVPAAKHAPLDFTIEHDNRAGTHHVFALFCDAPIALEPLRAALKKSGELSEVRGCRVQSIRLQKKLL